MSDEMKYRRAAPRRYLPGSPFNVPPVPVKLEQFTVNDQVTHDKYGLGVVIGVEAQVAVLVDFGSHQERIPVPYVKLTKL